MPTSAQSHEFRESGSAGRTPVGAVSGIVWACVLLGALCGFAVAATGLNALYLCASVVGCAFIARDFRVGVVLLILLMPISTSAVFPHAMLGVTGLNPLNLLLIGTLGSYLLDRIAGGARRGVVPHTLLWLYIVPIVLAGVLGSRHVGEIYPGFFLSDVIQFSNAAGYLVELLVKPMLLVVYALLVSAAVAKSKSPERFLVPTLISIWVMSALVIVFVARGGLSLERLASSDSREFLSPLGLHANDLGRMYAVAYALLLFTWAQSKEVGLRLLLFASMGVVALALMLTFSRGAFVGFVVVNALFVLLQRSRRALIFFGLLAIVALFALPAAVYERVASGYGEGIDAISAGRVDKIWLPLLPEVLRSPVFGSGLGSILWSQPMRTGAGVTILAVGHPHNAYLEAALDMGIGGLILLCAYFVHVWKQLRALSADPALGPRLRGFFAGAAAGLACLAVADLTDSSLAPRPEQVFLWLAIGMMYGLYGRRAAK